MENSSTPSSNTTNAPAKRLRILLLCDYNPNNAATVTDSIHAFQHLSQHEYVVCSTRGDMLAQIDVNTFDGIFIHYSLVVCFDEYLAPATRRKIRTFQGYKALYIQDEYRFINRTIAALNYLQIHVLFSVVGPESIDQVYSPEALPNVRKVTVLTGYVPDELMNIPTKPYSERALDVSYRARKVPLYLGEHTLQKWQISDRFAQDAARYNLKVDLSWREEDRIYGQAWIDFIANSKATLGTESGASVCDFTGEIQTNVERHLMQYPNASFEELRARYFAAQDGQIVISCISPRCFEAAALRTLMIMYEGAYSGILQPGVHYVLLKHDHSNIEDVVAVIKDPAKAEPIIQRAYDDIIASQNYNYQSMINTIDRVMEETRAAGLKNSPKMRPYSKIKIRKTTLGLFIHCLLWMLRTTNYWLKRIIHSMRTRLYRWLRRHTFIKKIAIMSFLFSRFLGRQGVAIVLFVLNRTQYTSRVNAWSRLRILQQFFLQQTDAMVHIYVNRSQKTLDIVALPIGADPWLDAKEPMTFEELKHLMLTRQIDTIRWHNQDTLGLGTHYPFGKTYNFTNHISPKTLIQMLMPTADESAWISNIYQSAASGAIK